MGRRSKVQKRLRSASDGAGEPATPSLRSPEPKHLLDTLLGLQRRVDLAADPDEIVRLHLEAFEQLMPSRYFSVRTVAIASTGELVVHESGTDTPSGRALLADVRNAVDPDDELSVPVEANEPHEPITDEHEDLTRSDVPLMDGENIIGALSVEYDSEVAAPVGDAVILGQLGLALSAVLRNARKFRAAAGLGNAILGLLRKATQPVVVLGPRRRIVFANAEFLAAAGLEAEDAVGSDLLTLVAPAHRSTLRAELAVASGTSGVKELTPIFRHASTGDRRVPLCVLSQHHGSDEGEALLAIGRDRSEVQQLEQQVIQAEKLATLGQLAAGVVHELNNPLTSISVYSDFLLRNAEQRGFDPDDIERLRRIVRSGERILRFTRDLVAYARPATEEPRFVRLAEIVDQSLVFCDHVIREVGATVERQFDETIGLYGVSGQLHQVFINLITNACQAIPEGVGRLEIVIERADEHYVAARVKDNGAGIAAEIRDGIFEPFFSTKGEGKGTGLGLSIVRKIVEQHRGRVTAESCIGEGAVFSVLLPSKAEPAPPAFGQTPQG